MDRNKPPDPPDILGPSTPPESFSPATTFPFSPNPLSQLANVAASLSDSQIHLSQFPQSSRKRNSDEEELTSRKLPKSQIGRSCYNIGDKSPFIVHVSRVESTPNAGTTLHPVSFGMFLMKHKIANIIQDGVKRVGRNRVSVEFTSPQDANAFLVNGVLSANNYVASIPNFNVTRLGVVQGVPRDMSEEEIMEKTKSPDGCGQILKVRRISRKVIRDGITEWLPTERCVFTFDGQVLPPKVYCAYTSLEVTLYIYPTIQCRKCCRFGHVESLCRSKPRCSKCGNDHPGDGCSISQQESICVLCSGNHFANSKDCPEYGRQKEIKRRMAEKAISYAEAEKSVPRVSRKYANAAISKSQTSYRKTIVLKPKTHAPLSPSYDKVAHNLLTSSPPSSQPNGCALNSTYIPSPHSDDLSTVLALFLNLLTTNSSLPISNPPSNVAIIDTMISHLLKLKNGHPPNVPAMECEERVS